MSVTDWISAIDVLNKLGISALNMSVNFHVEIIKGTSKKDRQTYHFYVLKGPKLIFKTDHATLVYKGTS